MWLVPLCQEILIWDWRDGAGAREREGEKERTRTDSAPTLFPNIASANVAANRCKRFHELA